MRAARYYGSADVRVEDIQVPQPRPHEALVAVKWVGLCGSDAEEFVHGPIVARPPVTLGHEFVGVVEAAAEDGSGPPVGTRVVVDVNTGCGRCFWCMRREEGICADLEVPGLQTDGGLADFIAARADRLLPIPAELQLHEAALVEPLAVAIRGLRKMESLEDQGVLIMGGGTVGMLAAQVARSRGAAQVVVLEPAEYRREILSSWGIKTFWHRESDTVSGDVTRLFPDHGIDVVVECSGRPGVPSQALSLVRRGGTVIALGVVSEPESIDFMDLVVQEKTIFGSVGHMYDDEVAEAVWLLASGKVEVSKMVTHTVPLEEVGRAFEILTSPNQDAVKILVQI